MSEGEGYYTVILPPGTTQRATRGGFLMCLLDQENHLTLPIPVILSPLTVVQSYHFLFASKPKPHITNNKYPPPQPSHLDVPVGIFCFDKSDFSRNTGGETRDAVKDIHRSSEQNESGLPPEVRTHFFLERVSKGSPPIFLKLP